MGKKPQRFSWPEAKKRCRINQLDIEMAKRLGFGPDALIHAIPDPKQKWKLPVKQWIHELHFKRFGEVLGETPLTQMVADFWEQNEPSKPSRVSKPQQSPAPVEPCDVPTVDREFTDEDVPF